VLDSATNLCRVSVRTISAEETKRVEFSGLHGFQTRP